MAAVAAPLEALPAADGARTLADLEAVIERGKQTFIEVGGALLEIRDRQLYRARGFATFDGYCRDHWDFGSSRAGQLIAAAEVAQSVTTVTLPPPPTERTARELVSVRGRLGDAAVREVWQQATQVALRKARPVTAADVREAASTHLPAPSTPEERTTAYRAGRVAYDAGQARQANPHPPDQPCGHYGLHAAWEDGWDAGARNATAAGTARVPEPGTFATCPHCGAVLAVRPGPKEPREDAR